MDAHLLQRSKSDSGTGKLQPYIRLFYGLMAQPQWDLLDNVTYSRPHEIGNGLIYRVHFTSDKVPDIPELAKPTLWNAATNTFRGVLMWP